MSVPALKSAPQPAQVTATEIAELRATNATLTGLIDTLRSQLAERERERLPTEYFPLKKAASLAGVSYERARVWHGKRLINSRKDGGRVVATIASLIERRVLLDGS